MDATWSRPEVFEPFTDLAEAPFKGRYVNISEHGYRVGENQGPWPPRRGGDFVVFLFGGSTTFGYGLADDWALGSALQRTLARHLKPNVEIYNFGRGRYYSTQERILLEKLLLRGFVPDLAIFVDGMNDFYYNAGQELDIMPIFEGISNQSPLSWLNRLPLARVANHFFPHPPTQSTVQESAYDRPDLLMEVINRYRWNKSMIEGIANEARFQAVFVWQPAPLYRYDMNYSLFHPRTYGLHTFERFGYPLMRQVVDKTPLKNFVWCADIQDGIHRPLYVDEYHYSPELIEMLSGCISGALQKRVN